MIRGTSAKYKFELPCQFAELKSAKIVFWQKGNSGPDPSRPLPIIKVLGQCEPSAVPNELYVSLSQEETLRFTEEDKAYVQLVVDTIYGKHIASREEMITVYPIYDDAILGDDILPTPGIDLESMIIIVDDNLSDTSSNPVQNKVITQKFNQIDKDLDDKQDILIDGVNIKTINGQGLIGSGNIVIAGGGGGSVDVDDTLEISGVAADAKITGDKFKELSAQIADILYEPIDIVNFKNNVNIAEIGSTIDFVTLTWSLNKPASTQSINGEVINPDITKIVFEGINSDTDYALCVTDERDNGDTATTKIVFVNGVYYGASTLPDVYNSEFILGLKRELRSNKLSSINVTAGEGQYIYYCLPTGYGECAFTLGGFAGGFELVDTIYFENESHYEESYYIYRSSYANLGNPKVTIS